MCFEVPNLLAFVTLFSRVFRRRIFTVLRSHAGRARDFQRIQTLVNLTKCVFRSLVLISMVRTPTLIPLVTSTFLTSLLPGVLAVRMLLEVSIIVVVSTPALARTLFACPLLKENTLLLDRHRRCCLRLPLQQHAHLFP